MSEGLAGGLSERDMPGLNDTWEVARAGEFQAYLDKAEAMRSSPSGEGMENRARANFDGIPADRGYQ